MAPAVAPAAPPVLDDGDEDVEQGASDRTSLKAQLNDVFEALHI